MRALARFFFSPRRVNTRPIACASGSISSSHTSNDYLAIGGNKVLGGSAKYFNGYIDEARIYSTTLTEDDVKALYLNPEGHGNTKISGDQISTGKIQSNNWNNSSYGSLIDLNNGTVHFGGSGSNAEPDRYKNNVVPGQVGGKSTVESDSVRESIVLLGFIPNKLNVNLYFPFG